VREIPGSAAEPRVRVCSRHHQVLEIDERKDSLWCTAGGGHECREGGFAVVRESQARPSAPRKETEMARPKAVPEGDRDRKGSVSAAGPGIVYEDGSGARLRFQPRRHVYKSGVTYEVYMLHIDGKVKRSGVLSKHDKAQDALVATERAGAAAVQRGWKPAIGRTSRGLTEIPMAKAAPARKTA
jgi:hypothetical protein